MRTLVVLFTSASLFTSSLGCGGDATESTPAPAGPMADIDGEVCAMASGADRVFWKTRSGEIQSIAKAGGAVSTIATGQSTASHRCDVVADGEDVYWPDDAGIRRANEAGVVDVVADPDALGVSLDGDDLVWWGGGGAKRAPKGGGAIEDLPADGEVIAKDDGLFAFHTTCDPDDDGVCSVSFDPIGPSKGALPYGAKSGRIQRCGDGFCAYTTLGSNTGGVVSTATDGDFEVTNTGEAFTSDATAIFWDYWKSLRTRSAADPSAEPTELYGPSDYEYVSAIVGDDARVYWAATKEGGTNSRIASAPKAP
jgi:hypothetical protein